MSQRKESKISLERLTLILFILVLTLCVYLLTDHRLERFLGASSLGRGAGIGEILRPQNSVRRRLGNDLQYLDIANQAKVFDGDMVFTGKDSSVEIKLSDGSSIKLSEDSLVALHQRAGENVLEIQKGSIVGTLGARQSLLVEINNQVKRVTSTHAGAQVAISSGDQEFTASDDSVKTEVQDSAGKSSSRHVEVWANSSLELVAPLPDALLKVGKMYRPPSERAPASVMGGRGIAVHLGWHDPHPAKNYEIMLGTSAAFSGSETRTLTANEQSVETPRLMPGRYFWRVRRVQSASDMGWSKSRQFNIEESGEGLVGSPRLKEPAAGQAFVYNPDPRGFLRLSWDARESAHEYLIQLARGATFSESQVVMSQVVSGTQLYVQKMSSGIYSWRVSAILESGEMTVFSDPIHFEIDLDRPVPQNNDRSFEIEEPEASLDRGWRWMWARVRHILIAEAYADGNERAPDLHWQAVAGAVRYQIMIARSADLKVDLKTYTSNTNALFWGEYSPGDYYWRVTAVEPDGRLGILGLVAHFKVQMKSPVALTHGEQVQTANSSMELNQPLKDVKMEWRGVRFSKRYEVDVQDAATKASVFHGVATSKSLAFRPSAEGHYQWRVRALDVQKNPITRFSDYADIQVTRNLVLKAPELQSPANNQVVTIKVPRLKNGRAPAAVQDAPLKLDWHPVDGAAEYGIQVAKDPGFQQMVLDQGVSANTDQVKVPTGSDYYWRVSAKRGRSVSSYSEVRKISFNQSVTDVVVPPSKDSRLGWRYDLGLSTLVSTISETTSDGIVTQVSSAQEIPSLMLGAGYGWKNWDVGVEFFPTIPQSQAGIALPFEITDTLMVERKDLMSFGSRGSRIRISLIGDLSYQTFSDPSVDTTNQDIDTPSVVVRTTSVLWADIGPRAYFHLGSREHFVTVTIGHSLHGTTSEVESTGYIASSVSGLRFQLRGEFMLTRSIFLPVTLDSISLSGQPSISQTGLAFGLGIRF
jgi:hypothetical protein